MTVSELISELLKLDPTAIVLVDGYEGGYAMAESPETIVVTRIPDIEPGGIFGEYDLTELDAPAAVKAVVLSR